VMHKIRGRGITVTCKIFLHRSNCIYLKSSWFVLKFPLSLMTVIVTSVSCRRRTRATRCLTHIVLCTAVDAQREILSKVVGRTATVADIVNYNSTNYGRQFITLSVSLCACCDDRHTIVKFTDFGFCYKVQERSTVVLAISPTFL